MQKSCVSNYRRFWADKKSLLKLSDEELALLMQVPDDRWMIHHSIENEFGSEGCAFRVVVLLVFSGSHVTRGYYCMRCIMNMRQVSPTLDGRIYVPLQDSYETSCALTIISRPFGLTVRLYGSLDRGLRISTKSSVSGARGGGGDGWGSIRKVKREGKTDRTHPLRLSHPDRDRNSRNTRAPGGKRYNRDPRRGLSRSSWCSGRRGRRTARRTRRPTPSRGSS